MKYRFPPALPLAHSLSLSGPSTVNIIVCSIQTFNLVSFTIPLLQYGLPLKIVSYKDLYGWTMDDIVKAIGLKNNCTFWSFSTSGSPYLQNLHRDFFSYL